MVTIDIFDIIAFIVLAACVVVAVGIVVVLGGLPGKIAARHGHPQAKAIAAAGWISLVTLFALWPVAFVWAFFEPKSTSAPQSGGPRA